MTQMILATSGWLNFNFITSAYMAVANAYLNLRAHMIRRAIVNRTINELSALSDRELNDMGLHRGMIRELAEGSRRA